MAKLLEREIPIIRHLDEEIIYRQAIERVSERTVACRPLWTNWGLAEYPRFSHPLNEWRKSSHADWAMVIERSTKIRCFEERCMSEWNRGSTMSRGCARRSTGAPSMRENEVASRNVRVSSLDQCKESWLPAKRARVGLDVIRRSEAHFLFSGKIFNGSFQRFEVL